MKESFQDHDLISSAQEPAPAGRRGCLRQFSVQASPLSTLGSVYLTSESVGRHDLIGITAGLALTLINGSYFIEFIRGLSTGAPAPTQVNTQEDNQLSS